MVRLTRLVVPGYPHHVTQRGIRRLQTFFSDEDYKAYLDLLAEFCMKAETAVWAYCLMPNHVHLILVPSHEDGLRGALSETHRRYARRVNKREDWHGHLWQERFFSVPMEEAHCLACARYIERNPVRAGLVKQPGEWPFSSARAHLAGKSDDVVSVGPLLEIVQDWDAFISQPTPEETLGALRGHTRTGRPLGSDGFLAGIEAKLGRSVHKKKPGPKPRKAQN